MKFLLDTHAVLWAIADDHRLGVEARERIAGGSAENLAISDLTLLEISMLAAKGRIAYEQGLEELLQAIIERVAVFPIDPVIAVTAMELNLPQADPFDRVIVATAMRHRMTVLSRDRVIKKSGLVRVVW